jgi:hypothetical protein
MLYADKNNINNLVTVPIVYSGSTRWEFTHSMSGEVYDLIGPANLSPSLLYWTIALNGASFPYLGTYQLKIFKLTGESMWKGNLILQEVVPVITYDKNSKRDNVIFE